MVYAYEETNGIIKLYEVDSEGVATEIPFDKDIYDGILWDIANAGG
jgi:hypothetical protein